MPFWLLVACGGGDADPATPDANQATCPSGWGTGTFFRNATASDIAACVEAGESLRARNSQGDTPLHLAASFTDDAEVIRALINAGARPDTRNNNDDTVLCLAVVNNESPAVIQALLDGGSTTYELCRANIGESHPGETPLHLAAGWNSDPDVAEVLIRAGADVNAEGGVGGTLTPLFVAACCNDNPAMIELLLRFGAELRWVAQHGARNENPEIRRIVVAAGAELSGALHRAVFNRTTEVTAILIAAGAELNGRETAYLLDGPIGGQTPLHGASRSSGANPNLLDDAGQTPLDLAEANRLSQVAALLRQYGGRVSG